MNAIDVALVQGEYRDKAYEVTWLRRPVALNDVEIHQRFLRRLIARASQDFHMYELGSENCTSAIQWMLGNLDATISFVEVCELVEMDWLVEPIQDLLLDPEMTHEQKAEKLKYLTSSLRDGDTG